MESDEGKMILKKMPSIMLKTWKSNPWACLELFLPSWLCFLECNSALSVDQMVYSFKEGAEVSLPLNQSIHKHMHKHNGSHSKYNHNRKKNLGWYKMQALNEIEIWGDFLSDLV